MLMRVATVLSLMLLLSAGASADDLTQNCLTPFRSENFDRLVVRSAADLHLAMEDIQCSSEFRSHDEANKAGFSFGFPVYGVPLQAGGTFSDEQRTTWKKTHCSKKSLNLDTAERKELEHVAASPALLQVVTTCLRETAFGLHSTITTTDNCDFQVTVRYIPNAATDKPPVLTAQPTIVGATCKGLPLAPKEVKKHQVPFGGETFTCRRTARSAVTIAFNTTKGQTTQRLLPLPEKPPLPPKPVYADVWYDTDEPGRPYVASCFVDSAKHTRFCDPGNGRPYDWDGKPAPFVDFGGARIPLGLPCGTCKSPDGTQVTRVERLCGGNCGWSYHRDPARGYDVDYIGVSPSEILWYRRWQSTVGETYNLYYRQQRRTCVANCDYEQKIEEWKKAEGGTCPPQ